MTGDRLRRLVPHRRRRRAAAGDRVLALVPHHRCERWLDHCLASLVGQTRPPDGIVVIDDASPEPPTEIVRRFPGVTLLRATANVGPYRLVQQVIDETSYDRYLFQDADDWSAPDRLELLLAAAERTGAELVGSDYVMLCTDEVRTLLHAFPVDVNGALAEAPTCHALQHPTSLVSRTLVTRLGGYASGMRFSGDDEFLRRAAHVARIVNVPRVLYFRRHRADSLTTYPASGEHRATVSCTQAPPVELTHVCGPRLEGVDATRPARLVRRTRAVPGSKAREPLEPVLVVGGLASGADALLWALAQHRSVVPLVDVSWLEPLSEAARRAGGPSDVVHTALSPGRRLHPLDVSGAGAGDVRGELAAAVGRVLLGDRPGDDCCWMAAVPPDADRIQAVLALFPGARVIHLVRDADDSASARSQQSRANAHPLPLDEAYRAWLREVRSGLAVERAVGAERLLRLRFDELTRGPEGAVRRCLDFVGLDFDPACVRPLGELDLLPAEAYGDPGDAAPARELSTALCGPGQHAGSLVAGDSPVVLVPTAAAQERTPPRPMTQSPPPAPTGARPLPAHVGGPAALLQQSVPAGSVVAVVTKGEGRFLELDGHDVWHFPRTAEGEWAGYHPATSDDVIRHLEELERRGARYFLIPSWARWWLDHYTGLRPHLARRGRVAGEEPDGGIVFELDSRGEPATPSPLDGRCEEQARPRPAGAPGRRRSVSVIAWDTAHNPLGRAHVLAELLRDRYDVEVVGAEFEQFGTGVWAPLKGMDLALRTFPGGPFPEHLGRMEAFAPTVTADAVVVSKPRLPSYLLGILAKALRNRPLVLDVDDRELTFVGATQPLSIDELRQQADDPGLHNPYGSHWTRHCESLVGAADCVTVSNETLQSLFGGTIVPHARDERLFDPARYDRRAVRRRFGFEDGERIVLFAGTPRRHKGVVELAAALREVGDPRARLCLIGTSELESLRKDLVPYADLIRVVPYQPFAELPALLAAADMVAVLQDPESDVSQYQMPAKVTDALAMQRPCLVRSVPPLERLVTDGHLEAVSGDGLAAKVAEMLGDEGAVAQRAQANREVFLEHFSFYAVRPRLEAIMERLLDRPPPLAEDHRRLLAVTRERFGGSGLVAGGTDAPAPPGRRAHPARRPHPRGPGGDTRFDVVMFWKQNDTGIYGRRHDMFMQHLARSARVGQVVQFDAPIDVAELRRAPADGVPSQSLLVRDRTMRRIRGVEPVPGLHQHSFVYSGDDGGESLLPHRGDYLVHVKDVLARHGVGERPVVFWVYPKCLDFPEIARALTPD
ncbi:MAG: glycosyltransferase, partial [Actinomycetota bacterium]|nr:glycosyltransferase [Actinomycetota bacterium]